MDMYTCTKGRFVLHNYHISFSLSCFLSMYLYIFAHL